MIAKVINSIFAAGYKRVIVPGFGAFIKRNSGEIIFTDMLSVDDGVLIASLIGSGMNGAEARQAVDKFTTSLRSEITRSGKAPVEGIGVITKTAKGGYTLCAADSDNTTDVKEIISTTEEHASELIAQEAPVIDLQEELIITQNATSALLNDADTTETFQADTESEKCKCDEREDMHIPEETVEDFMHLSSAKKARLRSALYGDMDEAKEMSPESLIDTTSNTNAQPDESELKSDKSNPEENKIHTAEEIVCQREEQDDTRQEQYKAMATVEETYVSATSSPLDIVIENKIESQNAKEIPTIKSDFTTPAQKDATEPYKPEINIRRPAKSKKRIDGVMVVAIIALIITLGIIAYGYFAERDINSIRNAEEEIYVEMEQPAK